MIFKTIVQCRGQLLSTSILIGQKRGLLAIDLKIKSQNGKILGTHYYCNETVDINGTPYTKDKVTNLRPSILSFIGRNLHIQKYHPLSHIRQRIVDYMDKRYTNARGNPLFSVQDRLSPIVTVQQNFDSLLIPKDHVSRSPKDTYYVNRNQLLRAHTSAHQADLISTGLSNFLVVGDVYRRDTIDKSHFPVFHQLEAVRLCSDSEVFGVHPNMDDYTIFADTSRTEKCQEGLNISAVKVMEEDMKDCLNGLALHLFGKGAETRWIEAYFPFTHPSWELEVKIGDEWVEMLGCGIMEQKLLNNSGVQDKIGWAFGLGLERWAMKLYSIPDIRTFWSKDTGFLSQFKFEDSNRPVTYQVVSKFPQLKMDMSFWLPQDGSSFSESDYFDIVRSIAGDVVEQVRLVDEFIHPKTKKISLCYSIVYRSVDKTLTNAEIFQIHTNIADEATTELCIDVRR